MGGMIAQLVATGYPDKVLSLTCIASSSGDPNLPPAKPEVTEFFFSPRRKSETPGDYINDKVALYKIYNHPDHFNEKQVRKLHEQAYERDHNAQGFKRQLLAMMAAEPRTQILKHLDIPSLIIHGDYDPVFSVAHGKHLADCIPNSEIVIVEKLGHGLPEALCEKLVRLIMDFIKKRKLS